MVSAAKSLGLRGLLVYGTPGVVVLMVKASEAAGAHMYGILSANKSPCCCCTACVQTRLRLTS